MYGTSPHEKPSTHAHTRRLQALGQNYQVIALARHSETEEWTVVYRTRYGDYNLWVRPLDQFTETVHVNGQTLPRFCLEPSVEAP